MFSDKIQSQIDRFRSGFPSAKLFRSASVGHGIISLSQQAMQEYIDVYEQSDVSVEKFVPASGAATRMFKDLLEFHNGGGRKASVDTFFSNLDRLPFTLSGDNEEVILDEVFSKRLLHTLPKGLLPFHTYPDETRTAAQEHLYEGLAYALKGGKVQLHFTVSEEHLGLFRDHLNKAIRTLSAAFDISYSIQNPETDTVAVDMSNNPVLLENGDLLMRPAGHGALLENLNSRDADMLFIKNIDNVLPERAMAETVPFKKALAGVLISFRERIFDLLHRHDGGEDVLTEGRALLKELGAENVAQDKIIELLNRPVRVCGMVENTGEPGGGPFFIEKDHNISLQIIESAQVDKSDPEQLKIFNDSTHFNPTDVVCGTLNYQGEKFDLLKYRDEETGFITEKTHQGRAIKAMELPGLWNGSMAHWNSIFVEVPLMTFNPVKTVNDLLRPEHQNNPG